MSTKAKSSAELLDARKAIEAAEKAEFRQAVMSLYIPLALFIACLIFSAGVFMVYYDEPAGWGFISVTAALALSAFLALFKFQNKFRARGIIPTKDTVMESNVLDARPDARPDARSEARSDNRSEAGSAAVPEQVIAQRLATGLPAQVDTDSRDYADSQVNTDLARKPVSGTTDDANAASSAPARTTPVPAGVDERIASLK